MRGLTYLHRLLILALVAAASVAFAFRAGIVPPRFSPLPALDLAVADAWLVDWRLAELGRDRQLCQRVLREPFIAAETIADIPMKDGCGLVNGVRITMTGTTRLAIDKASCPLAGALALWVEHAVQREAVARLGARVTAIQHFGGYACRNIRGAAWLSAIKSEHATANALDISGFVLADGRAITVLKHWKGGGPEAAFLRAAHAAACRTFRVVLGPEFNDLHKDHFHMDRGLISRCR